MKYVDNIQQLAEEYILTRNDRVFTDLYKQLKDYLHAYLYQRTRSYKYKDDAVDEALIQIWEKIDNYDPERSQFKTWAFYICLNCWRGIWNSNHSDRRRKPKIIYENLMNNKIRSSNSDSFKFHHYGNSYSEAYSMDESVDVMMLTSAEEQIDKMVDSQYKDILYDRVVNGMKYQELADKYDEKINTMKTKIRKSKKLLKEIIDNE